MELMTPLTLQASPSACRPERWCHKSEEPQHAATQNHCHEIEIARARAPGSVWVFFLEGVGGPRNETTKPSSPHLPYLIQLPHEHAPDPSAPPRLYVRLAVERSRQHAQVSLRLQSLHANRAHVSGPKIA